MGEMKGKGKIVGYTWRKSGFEWFVDDDGEESRDWVVCWQRFDDGREGDVGGGDNSITINHVRMFTILFNLII